MAITLSKSGKSGPRRRSTAQAFSDINVTPFVDVMLVLLVIFMVTAPMLTVGVPVDLPKTKAAKMNDQTEPLVVSVDANGKSYLQETELEGDALIERLIAISGSNPDAKIYVRGDQKINYGRVMEIMGNIAAAGFHKVSLIAEMPSGMEKGKNLRVSASPTPPPPLSSHPIMPAPQPAPQFAPQMPTPAPMQAPVMPPAPQGMRTSGYASPQKMRPAPISAVKGKASSPLRTSVPQALKHSTPANGPKIVRNR
ncbi:MAG: protein TolR [Alphaproteobacteria bacterium]|nr:protein TolR [Alphaproteobacteria bacterium]